MGRQALRTLSGLTLLLGQGMGFGADEPVRPSFSVVSTASPQAP